MTTTRSPITSSSTPTTSGELDEADVVAGAWPRRDAPGKNRTCARAEAPTCRRRPRGQEVPVAARFRGKTARGGSGVRAVAAARLCGLHRGPGGCRRTAQRSVEPRSIVTCVRPLLGWWCRVATSLILPRWTTSSSRSFATGVGGSSNTGIPRSYAPLAEPLTSRPPRSTGSGRSSGNRRAAKRDRGNRPVGRRDGVPSASTTTTQMRRTPNHSVNWTRGSSRGPSWSPRVSEERHPAVPTAPRPR
jgi:hypothetical protein